MGILPVEWDCCKAGLGHTEARDRGGATEGRGERAVTDNLGLEVGSHQWIKVGPSLQIPAARRLRYRDVADIRPYRLRRRLMTWTHRASPLVPAARERSVGRGP